MSDDLFAPMRQALERAMDESAPDAGLRVRKMFGGVGVYAHERMFASLSNVGLALKLDAAGRAALLREPGARPLQYEPDGPVSATYVVVPARIWRDPVAFLPWVSGSAAHVATLPPPKRRTRKS
ncbi:MAG: TfoX/Sxy family protein [Thermomicrobiales bacterium]|nr:TfoX/Sxy family protein [Thermomicrobiales bacterium]